MEMEMMFARQCYPRILCSDRDRAFSQRRKGEANLRKKKNHEVPLNSQVSPHRAVSAVRLLRIELGGAFADLLDPMNGNGNGKEMGYVGRTLGFRTRPLDDRDIRLVTDIVAGTTRWRRFLDHLISSLAHSHNNIEPLLLQNVKLAKIALRPAAGNMLNAILRRLLLLKDTNSLPLPKVQGNHRTQARALATIYSHPVWMVRRWIKYLGHEEAERLMAWNNCDPCFSLRANIAKGFERADLVKRLESLKVPHELSLYLDDFVRITAGMQLVIQSGLLKEGFCSVQDESTGLVVSVLDPQPGETIVDCCAAPGGKTLFMAARLKGQGMVCAIDINKGRLRILEETAKLHEVDNVIFPVHSDLRMFVENNTVEYDKVLLDAPCSGLGVLSKRADLRWNRRLEDMEQLKNLQDELFHAASTLVKPGGILVYSTCSIDPEENEERVAVFLQNHPEFCVDQASGYVSSEFVTETGFCFTNPVKHGVDGSFAARLLRCL